MLRYYIDAVSGGAIQGWAFDDGGLPIDTEIWLGGRQIGRAARIDRPDVVAAHPSAPLKSGFVFPFVGPAALTTNIELRFSPTREAAMLTVLQPTYARYLRAVWSHCHFVRDYFPARNADSVSDKDACATPNSPDEMIAIANHLYRLKSEGVTGEFAEFGCFKGFSTAMLSYACEWLGLHMHVFDSFAGLPPSASNYYSAGEFKGSLDEVKENVRVFGAPAVVTYHPGFFSDTLPAFDCSPLISLWMDVDLESSARDAMTAFPKVDRRGAVFSHECDAPCFVGGVHQDPHPNHVIPPIMQAYATADAKIEGRHISGATGAFWRRNGIAVMSNDMLLGLLPRL